MSSSMQRYEITFHTIVHVKFYIYLKKKLKQKNTKCVGSLAYIATRSRPRAPEKQYSLK